MKSTAKSLKWVRDLKDVFELRGITVAESQNAEGWGRLDFGTNAAVEIVAVDAVSKDVFGNDLIAFTPHYVKFSYIAAIDKVLFAQIMLELGKRGIKIFLHTDTTLAGAEAAAASAELEADIQWKAKGM